MFYVGNPTGDAEIHRVMREGRLGCMTTPAQRNEIPIGAYWAADNGKFGQGWPGAEAWFEWLSATAEDGIGRLLFATLPDVVGDAEATLLESAPWLEPVHSLGVPSAFVAQDGCSQPGLLPWGEFSVLFLGGSDEFKLGPEGASVTALALQQGIPVHMGRVNSRKRLKYALDLGCATADGTFLTYAPTTNLPRLIKWFDDLGLDNFRDYQRNAA